MREKKKCQVLCVCQLNKSDDVSEVDVSAPLTDHIVLAIMNTLNVKIRILCRNKQHTMTCSLSLSMCLCVCYVPKQQTLNRQNKHFRRRRHSAASSQLTRISPIKPYSSEQENQQKLEQASKMKQKTDQQCRASSCVET